MSGSTDVLVTGPWNFEKLLGIPKMERSTGEHQSAACLGALNYWHLRAQVHGLVFDTTASNTGLHHGACTLIEEDLGRELLHIAGRHHVYQVILSSVFKAIFGPTGGPETGLFKRFKNDWPKINQEEFGTPPGDICPDCLRDELIEYFLNAIQSQPQTRADYAELQHL